MPDQREVYMTAVILAVLATVGMTATLAVGAVFIGTILWIAWPHALPVVLPKLVESGWIPTHLSWWTAVCLSYVWGILFRPKLEVEIENKKKEQS